MIKDTKLKTLSPTLRQKKRFVKIKIESSKKYEFKKLSENIIENLITYIGTIDFGKAGIWILKDKFDFENQTIVIKVSTKFKDKLIAALSLTHQIENQKIKINIVKVSSTLKSLEK